MAELVSVPGGQLDASYRTALNDAIRATWGMAHKETGGDLEMLLAVLVECLSRPVAALYAADERVDLQAMMGHIYSRARQIAASHDGPLTHRNEVN